MKYARIRVRCLACEVESVHFSEVALYASSACPRTSAISGLIEAARTRPTACCYAFSELIEATTTETLEEVK